MLLYSHTEGKIIWFHSDLHNHKVIPVPISSGLNNVKLYLCFNKWYQGKSISILWQAKKHTNILHKVVASNKIDCMPGFWKIIIIYQYYMSNYTFFPYGLYSKSENNAILNWCYILKSTSTHMKNLLKYLGQRILDYIQVKAIWLLNKLFFTQTIAVTICHFCWLYSNSLFKQGSCVQLLHRHPFSFYPYRVSLHLHPHTWYSRSFSKYFLYKYQQSLTLTATPPVWEGLLKLWALSLLLILNNEKEHVTLAV